MNHLPSVHRALSTAPGGRRTLRLGSGWPPDDGPVLRRGHGIRRSEERPDPPGFLPLGLDFIPRFATIGTLMKTFAARYYWYWYPR